MHINSVPVGYIPKFIPDSSGLFIKLRNELAWDRLTFVPRSEYYINKAGDFPYTYGKGIGQRSYMPKPSHTEIDALFERLRNEAWASFDICFLNLYLNQKDQLGWHSDDSPEIDDNKPIAVISLGVTRDIWFCPNMDTTKVTKLKLEPGSLCIMEPHMQETHLHRIPKADRQDCGERISLTFRGYANGNV